MTSNPAITGEDLPDAAFEAILAELLTRRQFDLGAYKDRCIRRRIAKRLRASGAHDVGSYLKRLAADDDELDLLLATLSIHVSQFFRNPSTFRLLERQIIPDLCRHVRASGRGELRLWSAGCAGGEEPYSLALLLHALAPADLNVTILATDVSEPVLRQAQTAVYPRGHLADVPAKVLASYFSPVANGYLLNTDVRRMVRFERHNLITAASYPQADLILCRNVLIYFTREEQARILARFAAALPENGILILGRAETLAGEERRAFHAEFPAERIYRRVAGSPPLPAADH